MDEFKRWLAQWLEENLTYNAIRNLSDYELAERITHEAIEHGFRITEST